MQIPSLHVYKNKKVKGTRSRFCNDEKGESNFNLRPLLSRILGSLFSYLLF